MSDFISARVRTFSKATERDRANPPPVDGNDPRYYSQSHPSPADESRKSRQGTGPCTSVFDERFFSNPSGRGVTHPSPMHDGPIQRDGAGFPTCSEEISSGAMEDADRIRRSTR